MRKISQKILKISQNEENKTKNDDNKLKNNDFIDLLTDTSMNSIKGK